MGRTGIIVFVAALLVSFAGYAQEDEQEEEREPTQAELLIEAVQDEETSDVQRLLSEGADANMRTDLGMPLLSYAAYHGSGDIVAALLEAGADIHAKDKPGATALTYAAAGGHAEITGVLIAAGSDVNSKDNTGWTPLMRATYAVHPDAIRALIEAGADVNATNIFDRTAIEMAEIRAIEEVLAALQGTPVQ